MQRRKFPSSIGTSEPFLARDEFAQSGAAALATARAAAISSGAILAVPVTRVLTIHPNNLSDFVLSLPALQALRESFPGARICGAMRPALAGLLHHSHIIDDVLPRAPGGLSQQTALMLQLRAQHFDIAVALSPSRSATILAWSSGAATRVGFACAKMDALLTHRVESTPQFGVEAYLEVVRAVGCAAHHSNLQNLVSLSPAAQSSASRLLVKHGIQGDFLLAAPAGASSPRTDGWPVSGAGEAARAGRRLVVKQARSAANGNTTPRKYSQSRLASDETGHGVESLGARLEDISQEALAEARLAGEKAWRGAVENFASPQTALRTLKEWPAPHWACALDELSSRAPVVLIGNAPSPVTPLMKNRVLDLGGLLDLPTMAALCGAARLFIGIDSGLMHLAAAQETPVVALFGPTDWRRRARGASTRVLHSDIECAPCLRRACLWHGENERACMTRLTPEEVVRAARDLIGL